MALRIAGPQQAAPEELGEDPTQDTPAEEQAEETPEMQEEDVEQLDESTDSDGNLSPVTAGYMGPEDGPFMCKNCIYFAHKAPNTCHIVAGHIEAEGCCNLYTPKEEETQPEDVGAPATEVTPDESQEPVDDTSPEGY